MLGGRAPDYRWGTGSLQELDHPPLLAPVTKRASTEHRRPASSPQVDEAFRLAAGPHRGPVFLDVAMEALFSRADGRLPDPAEPAGTAATGQLDPVDVDRVGDCWPSAQRPVLVLGSDVWSDRRRARRPGVAEDSASR